METQLALAIAAVNVDRWDGAYAGLCPECSEAIAGYVILKNPTEEERRELREWLGGFFLDGLRIERRDTVIIGGHAVGCTRLSTPLPSGTDGPGEGR